MILTLKELSIHVFIAGYILKWSLFFRENKPWNFKGDKFGNTFPKIIKSRKNKEKRNYFKMSFAERFPKHAKH